MGSLVSPCKRNKLYADSIIGGFSLNPKTSEDSKYLNSSSHVDRVKSIFIEVKILIILKLVMSKSTEIMS